MHFLSYVACSNIIRSFNFLLILILPLSMVSCDKGPAPVSAPVSPPILNSPPQIQAVSIDPANPGSNSILTAVTTGVVDVDGDTIYLSFTWNVNGSNISNQSTDTLLPNFFTQGDIITVTATVTSNNMSSQAVSAPVTIKNAPPEITIAGPTNVPFGQLTSYDITVTDAEDDPTLLSITSAPIGMELSGNSLTWTPSMPLFLARLDVSWCVSATDGLDTVEECFTSTVEDNSRTQPLVRSGITVPSRPQSLATADFDNDGKVEILVTDNRKSLYTIELNGSEYVEDWFYPFDLLPDGTINSLAVYELNGDNFPDILVGMGNQLIFINGMTRDVEQRIDLGTNTSTFIHSVLVADINLNGVADIILLTANDRFSSPSQISIFEYGSVNPLWQSVTGNYGNSLAIGNVDQDPALEIVTGGGFVFDGETYVNEWAYGPGFGTQIAVGDLDNSGISTIVGADAGALRTYDAVFKTPLFEIANARVQALTIANIDSDPADEIITGQDQWGNLVAYSLSTTPVAALIEDWVLNSQNHGVSSIVVDDVDGDSLPEVIWASGFSSSGSNSLVIAGKDINNTMQIEWTNLAPDNTVNPIGGFQLDGPFVGAHVASLDGSNNKILFASANTNSGYDGTRLIAIDPLSGLYSVSNEIGTNWDNRVAIIPADYDNDGIDEVFMHTSSLYDGYMTAYDFTLNTVEWTSTTGLAAARVITKSDLNNDTHEDLISFASDGIIYAYDVFNQTILWQSTSLPGSASDLSVADLDGDGELEIIAATTTNISVYEKNIALNTYTLRWISENLTTQVGSMELLDTDGSGQLNIVVVSSNSYFDTQSTVSVYNGLSFGVIHTYPIPFAITDVTTSHNTAGKQNLLIAAATSTNTYPYNNSSVLVAVDATNGKEIWRTPNLIGQPSINSISYGDLNQDGNIQVLFGSSSAMYLSR